MDERGRAEMLDNLPYATNPLGEAKAELDRKYFPKKRSSLQV